MTFARRGHWAVPGWFFDEDIALFDFFLAQQTKDNLAGDLLELGVYYGKSAIVMGSHVKQGERLTVVDLFERPADTDANVAENDRTYSGLTRAAFERHYLRFHPALPLIVQAATADVLQHVGERRHRFVHVDASHLYEHVSQDLDSARVLLGDSGLVVVDDYRSAHTPGVAAAVWERVATGGLSPVALTDSKFYGTWGDRVAYQGPLVEWLATSVEWDAHHQAILKDPVVRVVASRPTWRRLRRSASAAAIRSTRQLQRLDTRSRCGQHRRS